MNMKTSRKLKLDLHNRQIVFLKKVKQKKSIEMRAIIFFNNLLMCRFNLNIILKIKWLKYLASV